MLLRLVNCRFIIIIIIIELLTINGFDSPIYALRCRVYGQEQAAHVHVSK